MLRLRRKSPGKAGVRVALLSGAAVAALGLGGLNAGTAAAAPGCAGNSITGKGSSLQNIAQTKVWGPGFEALCPGKARNHLQLLGSGAGLTEWNFNDGKGPINTELSFIGTDDAPTAAQIANVTSVAGGAQLAVVPIAQTVDRDRRQPARGMRSRTVTNSDLAGSSKAGSHEWSKIDGARRHLQLADHARRPQRRLGHHLPVQELPLPAVQKRSPLHRRRNRRQDELAGTGADRRGPAPPTSTGPKAAPKKP